MDVTKILLVEDEAIIAEYLRVVLERQGCSVVGIVDRGEDVLSHVASLVPDLIFMDIKLKGAMDGVEAAAAIQEHFDVPIIFLTSYSDEEILHRVKPLEPAGYIMKPFKEAEIRTGVQIALYKHRMERRLEEAYGALDERKQFLELVLKNIQSGILVVDTDQRITLVNRYVETLLQEDRSLLLGRMLEDCFPSVARAIAVGDSHAEVPVHIGEKEIVIGFRVNPFIRDGVAAGSIITFVDLTEIMKIRRQMRTRERLATMGETVAKVAHELRNPLFGITAISQVMQMELKLNPQQNELMTALVTEANRMNRLVEELLECSREVRLDLSPFDLVEQVAESVEAVGSYAAEKGVRLNFTSDGQGVGMVGDAEKIRQVLVNLLRNGIEATASGGTVSVAVGVGEGEIVITVSDTGPGIPESDLDRIFDVFYTTKKHGTGLGLPLCRKIVEGHGGTLKVTNHSGAVFRIVFPTPA